MTSTTPVKQSIEQFEQQLRDKVADGDPIASYQIVAHFEQKGLAPNQLEVQNRIHLLTQASNHGVGAASIMLGRWHLTGHYVKKDPAQAIMFFEHAATVCKDSYGFYQLAEIFQTGQGLPANPEKGLAYLQKAMQMGNPDAIRTFALQEIATHPDQAFQRLKENYKKHGHLPSLFLIHEAKAFNQEKVMQFLQTAHVDNADVSALLAMRYLQQKDIEHALPLADYAVSQQHAIGCFVRALIEINRPQGQPQEAHQYMLSAAQLGHVEAAYHAGIATIEQAEQITDEMTHTRILQDALQLLAQAAQAGYAPAQFSLGQCWLQGVGVERKPEEAFAWLQQAAQQGHIEAIFTLAINLPVEHEQHLPLLETAANAGHSKAMLCLGLYLQNHEQAEQALAWFEKAKAQGDLRANFMLGLAYRDGVGVAQDSAKAVELLNESGERGDADGYFALYQSYKDGLGVRKNKKSQAKYLKLAKEAGHPQAVRIEEDTV